MIAAGIAARAVAKKLASRAAGGITGKGAKQVNPMYKNTGVSKAEAKANARGLKAAQGKSLAPRGYKPDTAGRARAKEFAEPLIKSRGRKEAMKDGARALGIERTRLEFPKAPKLKKGR
jgi:hypothetical protein